MGTKETNGRAKSTFVILSIALTLALTSCHISHVSDSARIPYSELREGDLAFRCGRGFLSRAIVSAEDSVRYSHVGLVFQEDSVWMVVHAVPGEPDFEGDFDRVKAERIESFFASERATRGELLRPSNDLTTEKLEAMKLKAISMVRDSLRFDSKYDLEDHSEVYCTELVYMLYQQAGIDLSEGRRTAVDVPLVHSICLLPEDIYRYSDNISYFKF